MKSLFDVPEKKIKIESTTPREVGKYQSTFSNCDRCKLDKGCISPKMKHTGKGLKKTLVVAEAPGKTEDEKGIQLIGEAGNALRDILSEINIDLDGDCWKTNAIRCRPPHNRTPTNSEIRYCYPGLQKTIQELRPEKIILLGKTAIQSYFIGRQSVTSLEPWLGECIPDRTNNCFVFPSFHPSYYVRTNHSVIRKQLKEHLEKAFSFEKQLKLPPHRFNLIEDRNEKINLLEKFCKNKPEVLCFDFETLSLSPFVLNTKILCVGIATDKRHSHAFTLWDNVFPNGGGYVTELLIRLLEDKEIKKIGQNIKFETQWAKKHLHCDIEGWYWDTMQATHILDNRSGITGLKHQAFVNFGIQNYAIEIKEREDGLNNLNEIPIQQLLQYCAEDALYEFWLYELQKKEFQKRKELLSSFYFFMEGIQALSEMEYQGICIDSKHYKRSKRKLENELEELNERTQISKEGKLYKKKYGQELNINSTTQLKKLLFNDLGNKSIKQTKKGNDSLDDEVLENIKSEFTDNIIRIRKKSKLLNTFVKNYLECSIENKIHPNFMLHTVTSYRSSCSNPNIQNDPKRNEEAKRITRSGIIPSKGNQLLEVDYSGIEVRMAACYTYDKELIRYIQNPKSDMHRDMAMQIFKLDKYDDKKHNHLRYAAKNRFVFPEFYGDFWGNCVKGLWKVTKPEDKIHLKENGIKNFQMFEEHVEDIEHEFWNVKFREYQKWKEKVWNEYLETGILYSLSGFQYTGIMSQKEVNNYPIQGSAFHCLLWSLIQFNRWLKKQNMISKIIGEIHDSMLIDIVPEEKKDIKRILKKIMCYDIRKEWEWIIIPLEIEFELSKVDGNWNEMEKEE